MPQRLLILKGASRQRDSEALLPAIERYDSPLWRVLRKALRELPFLTDDLAVYALSGRFGLIPASTPIPRGHQTMGPERADIMRTGVLEILETLLATDYDALCLGLSHRYLRVMTGWRDHAPPTLPVTLTDGPQGVKLSQLRAWLEGRQWTPRGTYPSRLEPQGAGGEASIARVQLRMTPTEVRRAAQTALSHKVPGHDRFRDWYVGIDGQQVGVKWLVSVISGVPVARFDSAAARRVLLALGIEIERA